MRSRHAPAASPRTVTQPVRIRDAGPNGSGYLAAASADRPPSEGAADREDGYSPDLVLPRMRRRSAGQAARSPGCRPGWAATRSAGTHASPAVSHAACPGATRTRGRSPAPVSLTRTAKVVYDHPQPCSHGIPARRPGRPGGRRSHRSPRWSRGGPRATASRQRRWRRRKSTRCRPPAHAASGGSAAPRYARPASPPTARGPRRPSGPMPPAWAGVIALVSGKLSRAAPGLACQLPAPGFPARTHAVPLPRVSRRTFRPQTASLVA